MKRFRGGLVFKAHRLLYHSTQGLRVIKKRRRTDLGGVLGRSSLCEMLCVITRIVHPKKIWYFKPDKYEMTLNAEPESER